jgi:hypothetical protein
MDRATGVLHIEEPGTGRSGADRETTAVTAQDDEDPSGLKTELIIC